MSSVKKKSPLYNINNVYLAVYIAHYEDVCVFLLPSVPLSNFTFTTGCSWDQSRSRDFRGVLSVLLAYYSNSIGNH